MKTNRDVLDEVEHFVKMNLRECVAELAEQRDCGLLREGSIRKAREILADHGAFKFYEEAIIENIVRDASYDYILKHWGK